MPQSRTADCRWNEAEDRLHRRIDLPRILDSLLATLTPREEKTLQLRSEGWTLQAIGENFGASKDYASRKEGTGLKKIHHPMRRNLFNRLKAYR
jgi:DNA-directed RNA polymerase sigma subunit (sigma70/sigma32)